MSTSTIINSPPQFKNICRACRKINIDMRPIFNSEVNYVQVSQMLSFAAAINVRPDDKLPKSLCSPCLKKLIDTYKFLQMCIDSDLEMRNILKNHFNHTSIIIEKNHNQQQFENLLSSDAKPLLKNNEFTRPEIIPPLLHNDNNTHIDVIEYDGTLIKFENQDYDEFDNYESGGHITSDNKINETLKMRNCNENISRLANKNHTMIYNIDTSIGTTNLRCNFCEKEFIQKDDLDKHEAIHSSIKNNSTCVQSSTNITIKESLSPEFGNQPIIIGKFSCSFCKNTFHTWENLALHIGEHQIKSIYGTDIPGNPPNTLNKTIPINIEKSTEAFHQCTYCEKRFTCSETLICHISEHINEININKNLQNSSEQIIQLQKIKEIPIDIENEPPRLSDNENDETGCRKFVCEFCSSSYTLKATLRKHILSKHKKNISNLEKYQCSYCGRLFVKYLDMIRHRKIHKIKNISKNGKPSSVKHTGPPYKCQYCDSKLLYAYNLKRHIANLHPEYPQITNNITENITNENIIRKSATKIVIKNINALISKCKNKNYKCKHCGKLYNKYMEMIRHQKAVHINKSKMATTYKCPYCRKLIKWSIANLKRHIKNVHKDIPSSELDTIHIAVKRQQPVIARLKSIIKNKLIPTRLFKKLIKCQYCELTLCSKADVDRHVLKMHKEFSRIGLKNYDCMYCGKTFKKYLNMRSHQKHHKKRNDEILKVPERKLSILTTGKDIFENIEELPEIESTINVEDAVDPLQINKGNKSLIPVQCNICSVVLHNIYSYNRHIKQVHGFNENEPVKSKTDIKSFEIIHGNNNQLDCSECEKSYETAWGLRRHNMKFHRGAKHLNSANFYQCNICEKKFIKKSVYISHSRTHSEEPIDLQRKCIICKKILKNTQACRRHYRTIHIDKVKENENARKEDDKHKCALCSKSFNRTDSYKNHIKRHLVNDINISSPNKTVEIKTEKSKEKSPKKELLRHGENQHKKSIKRKGFRCGRCPLVFLDKAKYLKHNQIHKLKRQKIKHQQELLKKSIREKTYKCNICEKVISLHSNFKSHIAAHERRKIKIEEMENLKKSNIEIHDNKLYKNIEHIMLPTINTIEELKLNLETPNIIVNDQIEELQQQQTDVPEEIAN